MQQRRERVVIALDVGMEMAGPWDGKRPEGPRRFEVVVNCLKNWVVQKEVLGRGRTEWALVSLGARAELGLSWTSERDMVLATLDSLSPRPSEVPSSESLDLGTLVEVCATDLGVAETSPTTTRVLVVFGRSDAVPTLSRPFKSLDCFLDALYVHRRQTEGNNKCQEVYTFLTSLESRRPGLAASYFFETSSSLPRLHQHCALLLAHPLIREPQDEMAKKLDWKPQTPPTNRSPAIHPNLLPDPANLLPPVARADV